jgi:3-oxoacyl-(acyl-carrier-protein) synthase
VFWDHAYKTPISALQSVVGYSWAALGVFQFITACLAIAEGAVHPTINYGAPNSIYDLDYVLNHAREARIDTVITDQFGCGKNVVLVVQRCDA